MNASRSSTLLPYLRLFRLPNVFTAMADVMMGFLFVRHSLQPWELAASLIAASSLLYTAGMVLNDVFDYDVDLRERPSRPLPSGQISRARAKVIGSSMLAAGVGLACWGGTLVDGAMASRSGLIATLLAVCVVMYDGVLKKTPLGPFAMGSCRFLNVLLGMSAIPSAETGEASWPLWGFDASHLLVAGGIGLYIVGVTWFARTEARESNRLALIGGMVVMVAGIALLAIFPNYGRFAEQETQVSRPLFISRTVWPVALVLLSLSLWRRCIIAVTDPVPRRVQAAVKHGILSLIVLDAAVCLVVCGPFWALVILALLVPTVILGKWVYST